MPVTTYTIEIKCKDLDEFSKIKKRLADDEAVASVAENVITLTLIAKLKPVTGEI